MAVYDPGAGGGSTIKRPSLVVPLIVAGPYDYGIPNARPVADFGGMVGAIGGG